VVVSLCDNLDTAGSLSEDDPAFYMSCSRVSNVFDHFTRLFTCWSSFGALGGGAQCNGGDRQANGNKQVVSRLEYRGKQDDMTLMEQLRGNAIHVHVNYTRYKPRPQTTSLVDGAAVILILIFPITTSRKSAPLDSSHISNCGVTVLKRHCRLNRRWTERSAAAAPGHSCPYHAA
jgi:hypothetical protein